MNTNDIDLSLQAGGRNVPTAAWVVGGVPLLVTLIQTVLSLLDWTSRTLGIEATLEPVFAIDVLYEAAIVFKSRPGLVTSLFILIATAWIVQGLAMFVVRQRDLAFGAAGLASVLYLVLFFGVYSPLFDAGIGAGQLVGFFLVPVVATGLVLGAAYTHDWTEEVLERTGGRLGELEGQISEARERFETEVDDHVVDLSAYEAVAPTGVAEARESRERFHERCDDLLARVNELQATADPATRRSNVSSLAEQVEVLDPEASARELVTSLRRRVTSGVRTEFGSTSVRSTFGGEYTLSNLPTEYREVTLPPSGDAVHIDDLGDMLVRRLDSGEPLSEVGPAVTAAADHLASVREFLGDRETEVEAARDRVEERIETVRNGIDRLPAPLHDRIEELLIENRHDSVVGARAIERRVDDAVEALHDCQFGECERLLAAAENDANRLVNVIEFLRSVDGRVDHGGSGVEIPTDVDQGLVRTVAPLFADHYDRDVVVEDDRIEIAGDDPDGPADDRQGETVEPDRPDEPAVTGGSSGSGDGGGNVEKRPEEVLDSALFLLRELEEAARTSDGDRVQYQTGDLPSTIGEPSVLRNVERFLSHQTGLFDEVTLQSPEPPAFLEVVVAAETRPAEAMREARERFTERYG